MSKRKKKNKIDRGPTFVGLAPRYEKTREERRESKYKKHKNRQIDSEESTSES